MLGPQELNWTLTSDFVSVLYRNRTRPSDLSCLPPSLSSRGPHSRQIPMRSRTLILIAILACGSRVHAEDFDQPPINYSTGKPDNVVTRLQQRMDAGDV